MKKQLNSRKGVTVAEVVIALVIIAAISAFTLSLIVMSIGVENKSESAIEVKNAAENAIECFRFARDNAGKGEYIDHSQAELFFACLQMSVGGEDSPIKYIVGTMNNGTFEENLSENAEVLATSAFQMVTKDCTVLIEQIAGGFKFTATRGGEQIYDFSFPAKVETGGASK